MLRFFDKLAAVLRRDLRTAMRYRAGFSFQGISLLAEIAVLYYLAKAVGPGFKPAGLDFYPFLLVGTGFFVLLVGGVNGLVQTLHDAQTTGTIEVLMTTSTPAPYLVTLTAISELIGPTLRFMVFLAVGFALFRVPLPRPNIPAALLVFMLSVLIALAVGMFAASLQLSVQKGSAIVWLLGSFGWLVSGTMFPVADLPAPLRALAYVVPFTYSLDGLRLSLLGVTSVHQLLAPIAALAISAGILLPGSILLFSWVLKNARLRGTLSFY